MNAETLLSLLGRNLEDEAVQKAFAELRTKNRPKIKSAFRDWVLIRRAGVELGFVDEAYHLAKRRQKPPTAGQPILLSQVAFWKAQDDIQTFSGELPNGIAWKDTRDAIRKKLEPFEATRRSHRNDTWELPSYRLSVLYEPKQTSPSSILCLLEPRPWPDEGRIEPKTLPKVSDLCELFGLPWSDPRFAELLAPIEVMEPESDAHGYHTLEFTWECGLDLLFVPARELKKLARTSNKEELVFVGVRLSRAREEDARQYRGELPFGLSFDDSPSVLSEKVGEKRKSGSDDRIDGYAEWKLPSFGLHIRYDGVRNNLARIMIMAPGYM